MTSTRSGSLGGGRAPAGAALRGGALIVLAVLIGFALLSRGFDAEGGLVDDAGEPSATTEAATAEDGSATTVISAPDTTVADAAAARPPEEVTFLVLNGSGVTGAATRVKDALLALNYVPRSPDNTPERVVETRIYFIPGWRAEALAIAEALRAGEEIVVPLPDPPPAGPELGTAQVLIVLGEDGVIAAAAAG